MGGTGDMPIREAGPDAPGKWTNSAFKEEQRAPQQLMLPEVRACAVAQPRHYDDSPIVLHGSVRSCSAAHMDMCRQRPTAA